MPTPIGHALGGLIIGLALAPRGPSFADPAPGPMRSQDQGDGSPFTTRQPWHTRVLGTAHARTFVLFCVVIACLPDVDFAWGGHNRETHSLGFAFVIGVAVWLWQRSGRLAAACGLAVGTHVLFDWLGSDDFPPLGVMALWPFSQEFYFADAFIFEAISRRYWLPGFVQHNLLAVAREVVILAPIAAVLWWRRR